MQLTYLGHACFLATLGKTKLLFDPYITPNPLAKAVDVGALRADYILLSHGHYDHVADVELIYNNQPCAPTIVANLEMCNWYKKKGLTKVLSINPGGQRQLQDGLVNAVHEPHASSMPDGSYAGTAMGFVVQSQGKAFYFAGDTALHQDMQQIGTSYDLEWALLPIGGVLTMDVAAAVQAAAYVGTEKIIGMHYDNL